MKDEILVNVFRSSFPGKSLESLMKLLLIMTLNESGTNIKRQFNEGNSARSKTNVF